MIRMQRRISIFVLVIVLVISVIWFFKHPSYEPATVFLLALCGLLKTWLPQPRKKYIRKRLKGCVSFDYSNNNGKYTIGCNGLSFETKWSKASDTSIHIYSDLPSIDGVAVVKDKPNISDIRDAIDHDFSSCTRTAEEGDLIILKNKYSNYAVLKVMDIKDSSRSDVIDEVQFEYVINSDGKGDFR